MRPAAADERNRGKRGGRNPREAFEKGVLEEGGDDSGVVEVGDRAAAVTPIYLIFEMSWQWKR